MKKNILLSIACILWAVSLQASELPPYSAAYSAGSFFATLSPQQDKGIQLFPNPVTDGRLTIKSEESFNSVQILNITGEIVFNQEFPGGSNSEMIELTRLEKGIYLVRIGFAGRPNMTSKIIVK